MDGVEPVDECVVVLNVHVGGSVVVERVDVVGGVVLTFKDIIIKTMELLVDRETEVRKVSWRGVFMCYCVVKELFLKDI